MQLEVHRSFAALCVVLCAAIPPAAAENARPTPAEARAIAKEGFVYGLPIVMNYAVMYEYAVDPNSGQYKAPFNQIKNEARVFTYEDTAVITPNSDTPYSFTWLDLRAEPIVLSVPAVEKGRYYAVSAAAGRGHMEAAGDRRREVSFRGRMTRAGPRLRFPDGRRHSPPRPRSEACPRPLRSTSTS